MVARRQEIAFVSDATGEDEIHVGPATAASRPSRSPRAATPTSTNCSGRPIARRSSGRDKKLRLQFVDVETKKVTLVDQAKAWEIRDFAWSPDSKWVAFARPEDDAQQDLAVLAGTDKTHEVTDGWYDAGNPAFSADGKYLFFVSARDFNPIYSQTEWNHAYRDMARIYFVTLAKATPNPLRPEACDDVAGRERRTDKKKDKPKAGRR